VLSADEVEEDKLMRGTLQDGVAVAMGGAVVCTWDAGRASDGAAGRGLYSFASQLNLSAFYGIGGVRMGL
jgi:hypothetical protein